MNVGEASVDHTQRTGSTSGTLLFGLRSRNAFHRQHPHKYFNAGVMLLDLDSIRITNMDALMLRFSQSTKVEFLEQDVLNLHFPDWTDLEYKFNVQGLGSYAAHRSNSTHSLWIYNPRSSLFAMSTSSAPVVFSVYPSQTRKPFCTSHCIPSMGMPQPTQCRNLTRCSPCSLAT